jgi:RecG-like helicase
MLRDSEVVPLDSGAGRRYTTRELLAAEEAIVRGAEEGRDCGAATLDEHRVEMALAALPHRLTDQQAGAVRDDRVAARLRRPAPD